MVPFNAARRKVGKRVSPYDLMRRKTGKKMDSDDDIFCAFLVSYNEDLSNRFHRCK
jgi:hypothetical protein